MNTVEINGTTYEIKHLSYRETAPPPLIVRVAEGLSFASVEIRLDLLEDDSAARGQALGGIAAAGLRAGGGSK